MTTSVLNLHHYGYHNKHEFSTSGGALDLCCHGYCNKQVKGLVTFKHKITWLGLGKDHSLGLNTYLIKP